MLKYKGFYVYACRVHMRVPVFVRARRMPPKAMCDYAPRHLPKYILALVYRYVLYLNDGFSRSLQVCLQRSVMRKGHAHKCPLAESQPCLCVSGRRRSCPNVVGHNHMFPACLEGVRDFWTCNFTFRARGKLQHMSHSPGDLSDHSIHGVAARFFFCQCR